MFLVNVLFHGLFVKLGHSFVGCSQLLLVALNEDFLLILGKHVDVCAQLLLDPIESLLVLTHKACVLHCEIINLLSEHIHLLLVMLFTVVLINSEGHDCRLEVIVDLRLKLLVCARRDTILLLDDL